MHRKRRTHENLQSNHLDDYEHSAVCVAVTMLGITEAVMQVEAPLEVQEMAASDDCMEGLTAITANLNGRKANAFVPT